MLSRRDLMRNGLLISTVSGLAPLLAHARPMPADVWIIEKRMPAASQIIAAVSDGGAEALTFTADPGGVWMNQLEPRLKRRSFAFGGYTSAPVLFCLHYLARDYGMALAGLGEGVHAPAATIGGSDTLVDLRDPRFVHQPGAHTWLMLPRRA